MKTLIATFSLSAALLAPVATFAATTATTPTATPATVAATTATSQDKTNTSSVAMNAHDKSFGKQASDDRDGLSRIQEQSRQLGATN